MSTNKDEHTANFKHFHLLADSTLKQWGKEALIDYIHMLYRNWENADIGYNVAMDHANELQSEIDKLKENPPLKFEQLKPNMWVWDDKYKVLRQIHKTYNLKLNGDVVEFKYGQYPSLAIKYFFEINRFYRKEVK